VIDLPAYLARISGPRDPRPTLECLDALVLAHVTHVPFENLDILLGRGIAIDVPSVFAKLVTARRGGYCFEQNTLFAEVLRAVGFEVVPLAARVRWGSTAPTARTHMLLDVRVDGQSYLADVGFGSTSPVRAIPLEPGEHETSHGRLRLRAEPGNYLVLEMVTDSGWTSLYAFTREEHHAVDFEVANHYTSTHPSSHFTQSPRIALTTPAGRVVFSDGELCHRVGFETVSRQRCTGDELVVALREHFGMAFPPGTRFHGGPG
jgi:N-hydroxyarylamine O-acetyltransferase